MKIRPLHQNVKHDFPWFKHNPGWTYLDSSASALKPQCVIDEINDYYAKWSTNPHNTDSVFTYRIFARITQAREKVAKLFNGDPKEFVFTSGATESLNLIAHGLQPFIKAGDEIVLTYGEHGSNLLPWFNLCDNTKAKIIYAGAKHTLPTATAIINAVTSKTKIVSFVNISNLLGYEIDIKEVCRGVKKKNKNVIVIVDATQSVPHARLDVKNINIDFFVCSGYKMGAATGTGLAYIKSKWLNQIKPIRFGGSMNNQIHPTNFTYAALPWKFEGGTPHTAGILSWIPSIDYLNAYGWERMHKHELALKQYINQEFAKIKNLEYINPDAIYPIVLFNIKGVSAQDLAGYLGHKKIIVRAGLACAKLSHYITDVDAAVRASFYIYNDTKDVDRLVKALKNFKPGDELKHVL